MRSLYRSLWDATLAGAVVWSLTNCSHQLETVPNPELFGQEELANGWRQSDLGGKTFFAALTVISGAKHVYESGPHDDVLALRTRYQPLTDSTGVKCLSFYTDAKRLTPTDTAGNFGYCWRMPGDVAAITLTPGLQP